MIIFEVIRTLVYPPIASTVKCILTSVSTLVGSVSTGDPNPYNGLVYGADDRIHGSDILITKDRDGSDEISFTTFMDLLRTTNAALYASFQSLFTNNNPHRRATTMGTVDDLRGLTYTTEKY